MSNSIKLKVRKFDRLEICYLSPAGFIYKKIDLMILYSIYFIKSIAQLVF